MNRTEAERRLREAGFRVINRGKKTELWAFRDITVSLPANGDMTRSRNTIPDLHKAIRKAKLRQELEPTPLGKLADAFKEALDKKPGRRLYKCSFPNCNATAESPDDLNTHIDQMHQTYVAPKAPPPTPPKELRIPAGAPHSPNGAPSGSVKNVKEESFTEFIHRVTPPETQPPYQPPPPPVPDRQLSPPEMGFRKWKDDERRPIWAALRKITGLKNQEAADHLNKYGPPNPNGIPWNADLISNQRSLMRKQVERRRIERQEEKTMPPPATPPTTPKNKLALPASISLIMDDPDLTTTQKIEMLNVAKLRLPASVQLLLEDTELDNDQKYRMFLVLVKG